MEKFRLTDCELASYRTNGYLIRDSVFAAAELDRLCSAVERAVDRAHAARDQGVTYYLDGKRFVDIGSMTVQYEHSANSETIRVIEPASQLDQALEQLINDARIVTPVSDILGCSRIAVWTNKLNLKRPFEGSGFGWHQDSPYWVHNCNHVDLLPNVYLAFDDASANNGCLRVIRGSHQSGCLPGTDDGSQLGGFYTSPDCYNEADQVLLEVARGSLVFFDPHTIHGSKANQSDQARRAFIMTYQPADFPMLKTGEVLNVNI